MNSKSVLHEFKILVTTTIYEDNQACIQMVKNQSMNAKTKHLDIKLHFCRDVISTYGIGLEYIETKNQLADGLTKIIGEKQLQNLAKLFFSGGFMNSVV